MMRQIVLDTETTGLETKDGHRIIEIGCVEMINRILTGNRYHQYIQPDREIDTGAFEVHGISNEFLVDKPRFADIYPDFVRFVEGAELIIHNAPFDVGFLNYEFSLIEPGYTAIENRCVIIDSLQLARKRHPGQKNNLDALCKRYSVDNTHRELHGALLDAEILADVYLRMTGGQMTMSLGGNAVDSASTSAREEIRRLAEDRPPTRVIRASEQELALHRKRLEAIEKASGIAGLWLD